MPDRAFNGDYYCRQDYKYRKLYFEMACISAITAISLKYAQLFEVIFIYSL